MQAGKPETMGCWIAIGLEQHRRKMQRRFYSQEKWTGISQMGDFWRCRRSVIQVPGERFCNLSDCIRTIYLSVCLSNQLSNAWIGIGTLRSRTPRMPSLQTWHASTRYLNWHEVIAAEHEFCSSSSALKTLTFSLRHCKKSWFTWSTPWSLSDGRVACTV